MFEFVGDDVSYIIAILDIVQINYLNNDYLNDTSSSWVGCYFEIIAL